MAEPETPASLRQISALAACVTETLNDAALYKSPYVLYHERTAAVREKVAKLWEIVKSQPAGHQDVDSAAETTLRIGGELSELERTHAATVQKEFKIYEAAMDEKLKDLCTKLIDILGRSLVIKTLGLGDSGEAPPVPRDVEITHGPQPLSPSATETQIDAEPEKADSTQIDADSIHVDQSQPNNAVDQPAPINPSPTKKRSAPPTPSFEMPRKRTRTEQSTSTCAERTVEFNDVYQGGKAEIKHIITNYEDEWYIIYCAEHKLSFKNRPIMAGGKHLSSKIHNHLPRTRDITIARIGIRVLNCNAKLAEKNNQVTREAFQNGWEPPKMNTSMQDSAPEATEERIVASSRHTERETSSATQYSSAPRNRKKFEGIIDPVPGDIYRAYWSKDKAWHAVLVLPGVATDKSVDIGMSGSIQDLGLTEQLPDCYTYNDDSDTLKWREDYEDGGARVMEREFPVMYFDGLDFPSQSAVGWVSASNLEAGHVRDKSFRLLPHYQSAIRFLNAREKKQMEAEKLEQTNSEPRAPENHTPEPSTTADKGQLTDQNLDEPVNPPDSRDDLNEPHRQETPELPKQAQEEADEPVSNSIETKTSVSNGDPKAARNAEQTEQADIISISSNSPSIDSLDFPDEHATNGGLNATIKTHPTVERHDVASVPSKKYHPVSVEEVPDESERPTRTQDLVQTALDCLQMNDWYESPKEATASEAPATTTHQTNAPRATPMEKPPASTDRTGATPIPEGLLAMIRERKAEKLPPASSAQHPFYITSPPIQPQRSLSSGAVPTSRPTAPPARPASPPRRASVVLPVPRDLNAGVSTTPATYRMSHFSSMPPNPASGNQQAFVRHPLPHQHFSPPLPSNPLPNNAPPHVPQNRPMGSSQVPVALPPITIPGMAAGPGPQSPRVHQSPFSAPPHPRPPPAYVSRPSTAQSATSLPASPLMNDQMKYMCPGNATVSELRRVHTCPGCPKRYAQQVWRDKHIRTCHPEYVYNRVS